MAKANVEKDRITSYIIERCLFGGLRLCIHSCLSMSRISHKVMNEFGQNLVNRLGV